MADQQKPEKKIAAKETTKKKVKGGEAKAAEPAPAEAAPSQPPVANVAPAKKSVKKGKLLPKNKQRLPRRLKKAQKKAGVQH